MNLYTITHYRATNDTNGNPRRCFRVEKFTTNEVQGLMFGEVVAVFDEGYGTNGLHVAAWVRAQGGVAVREAHPVEVTPAEYRRLIEQGERLDSTNPIRTVWKETGEHHAYHRDRASARREVKRMSWSTGLEIRTNGDELHNADGTHRGTAPTTDGAALDRFERKMAAHRADGHTHA